MADRRLVSSVILGRREIVVPTEADDLRYLKYHWGTVYYVFRAGQADGSWRAIAKFGNRDELTADTADGLLDLIRHHYGPETDGYPFQTRRVSL